MNQIEQTITTLEIAEMLEVKHWQILRKLDGTEKTKGVIQILNDNKIVAVDYFIKSSYTDEKGEQRPCYKVTKMGCDFLANKFTGEKGIIFTAKYVKRFHDMEQAIRHQNAIPRIGQQPNTSTASIPLVTDWFKSIDAPIKKLMKKMELSRKGVYHEILLRLGEIYNLDVAKRIYRKENGFAPPYAMTLVEYFPQLQEETDKIIEELLKEYE